ncbi:MAG TPA: ABC transporter ATP-binding protein [Chitinophagaceae bacterium]
MPQLLSIQNLSIDFQTESGLVPGVRGIDLQVDRGEIVALVGESGSGKSITSLAILQLLPTPPTRYPSGRILFSPDGKEAVDLLTQTPEQLRRLRGNRVAMIFQEPMTSLNPVFTCGHQVAEAIKLHQSVNHAVARQQTLELFEKVKLPDPAAIFDRYPHQLSGGQKQRVMIAMAMSCHPALLICDEPTTALDVTVQQTILQLIKELQQTEEMGVLFITHDLGVVAEIADRVAVMYKGSIAEQGPVRQIMQQPQHPYTRGLLACRPALHPKGERLPVVSDFMDKGRKETPKKQPLQNDLQAPRPADLATNTLLKIDNLRVWYPSRKSFLGKTLSYTKAVDDVSFDLYKGETLGLVGESGCGKTTLGRALLRLVEPTGGDILLNGESLLRYSPAQLRQLRKNVQIIFQDPYSSLNPRMTIGNAIEEVLQVHKVLPTSRQRRERVTSLLEKVSLQADHYGRYPHEFSGGQRQRIVIARALALNPSFLVCDESVSALDVSVQAQVLNLLNDLKKEFGFTVIFISHDLSVIHYISDRIMVMQKGKIVETGEAGQVYYHPKEAYTQRLIASIPKL